MPMDRLMVALETLAVMLPVGCVLEMTNGTLGARSPNTNLVVSGNIGTTVSLTALEDEDTCTLLLALDPLLSAAGWIEIRNGDPELFESFSNVPLADHGRNANVPRIAITRVVCPEPIVSRSGPKLTPSPCIRQII